jgi:uncharacterized protein (TIGR03546 family)
MFLIDPFLELIDLLNSDASAGSIAAAVLVGLALGFFPFLTLQVFFAVTILLFCRVHIGASLFAMGGFQVLALLLQPLLDGAGCLLLESASLEPLWTGIYNSPLWLLGLNNSIILSSTLLLAITGAPLFFLARFLVQKYRDRFEAWFADTRFAQMVMGWEIFQRYRERCTPLA